MIFRDFDAHGINTQSEHCRHSYDCCGQWYSGGLTIIRKGNRVLARVRAYMNV
jgi:hypothetical protein